MAVVPLGMRVVTQAASILDSRRCTELLVATGLSRDKAAFHLLFSHFAPRVKAFIISRGTDAETAEDLAQDVMVAVWHKARSFDPAKAEASTWIFTIARNLAIDFARRGRHPQVDEAVMAAIPDDAPVASEMIISGERNRRIQQALSALPEEQATIMHLCFFDGRSHNQIALDLGLPLGTVKSRVRLAVKRIRSYLDEGFDDH